MDTGERRGGVKGEFVNDGLLRSRVKTNLRHLNSLEEQEAVVGWV